MNVPDDGQTDLPESLSAELLMSAAAHDLRAPLVTIQGFLSGLEGAARCGNWEQFQADTQRIHRACERMRRILEDLQEYVREGGRLRQTVVVPLAEVLREAQEQLAGMQEANVDLSIPDSLPLVRGDRLRLMRVFQNLLENALRAVADQDQPKITITAKTDDRTVTVLIRDNGHGIAPERIPEQFQPFRQLGGRAGACGLGLSIAQRIVAAHGGSLKMESAGPGLGATLSVTLPRMEEMVNA